MESRAIHICSNHFSQTDNGDLCNVCSNLSKSSFNHLQSVCRYRFCYSLNSQIACISWFTLVLCYKISHSTWPKTDTSISYSVAINPFYFSCGVYLTLNIKIFLEVTVGCWGNRTEHIYIFLAFVRCILILSQFIIHQPLHKW